MTKGAYLGEFEMLVLISLGRLGDDAYAVTIKRELERRAKRSASIGAIHAALGRLADKGFVAFHVSESVAAASLTSQVIRGPLGRTRPRNSTPPYDDQYEFHAFKGFRHFENRAFPSIHSSSGFAAASAGRCQGEPDTEPGVAWY